MNSLSIESDRFAALARIVVEAACDATRALLAHVHESLSGYEPALDRAEVSGMTAHMLRDIGAETFLGSSDLRRELEFPRL
jgi:hypothetical protein